MQKLVDVIEGRVLSGADRINGFNISGCFATELMSDALAFSKPGMALLTGLTTVQAVHTADVAELRVIIFAYGRKPEKPVLELAKKKKLPLIQTEMTLRNAVLALKKAGIETNLK